MKKFTLFSALMALFVAAGIQAVSATFVNNTGKQLWVRWGAAPDCAGTQFILASSVGSSMAVETACHQELVLLADRQPASWGVNVYNVSQISSDYNLGQHTVSASATYYVKTYYKTATDKMMGRVSYMISTTP